MENARISQAVDALLREVGPAHHGAYAATDGVDPDWPIWYAEFLHDRLCDALGATFTKSDLVYLLVLATREQALSAPGRDWVSFTTRFLVQRYE